MAPRTRSQRDLHIKSAGSEVGSELSLPHSVFQWDPNLVGSEVGSEPLELVFPDFTRWVLAPEARRVRLARP